MPCYPAFALLLGSAMAVGGAWVRRGTRVIAAISGLLALAMFALLYHVRGMPTPGDISQALSSNPSAYTLSLGHMEDLTLNSFAYFRLPLLIAGIAFLVGALGTFLARGKRAYLAAALMMIIFFHAARLALVVFEPYLSSRPLADAFLKSPDGALIVDHHYYEFSSVFFYTNRTALLLNGRRQNLVYGSYAPGAPNVFIQDSDFAELWRRPERYYIFAGDQAISRLEALAGPGGLVLVAESGGRRFLRIIRLWGREGRSFVGVTRRR